MGVQAWLGSLDQQATASADAVAEVAEARRVLGVAAAEVGARLAGTVPAALPLSVTKGRAGAMTTCEGQAVARWRSVTTDDWAVLRGRALDAFVAHTVFGGPVADPVADAASVWEAQGNLADAETMRALPPDGERAADLAELAAAAGRLRIDPSWVPRVEVRVGTTFGAGADAGAGAGALRLAGRIDLLLGGPGTGRPAVAVEVKSGHSHSSHLAEAYHYALLCALRHGAPPAGIAVWYPDGTLVPLRVEGAVLTSAHRAADVAVALAELWEGRPPRLRSGPHCGWCPAAAGCPAAADLAGAAEAGGDGGGGAFGDGYDDDKWEPL